MKKYLLSLHLLLITSLAFAQIQQVQISKSTAIGKVKTGIYTKYELSYSLPSTNDTLYHFYYNDLSYTQINVMESVFFKEEGNTLNDFYTILLKAFDNEVDQEVAFKLGETNFLVVPKKMIGVKYLSIAIGKKGGSNGLTNISRKELDKLFGRN